MERKKLCERCYSIWENLSSFDSMLVRIRFYEPNGKYLDDNTYNTLRDSIREVMNRIHSFYAGLVE